MKATFTLPIYLVLVNYYINWKCLLRCLSSGSMASFFLFRSSFHLQFWCYCFKIVCCYIESQWLIRDRILFLLCLWVESIPYLLIQYWISCNIQVLLYLLSNYLRCTLNELDVLFMLEEIKPIFLMNQDLHLVLDMPFLSIHVYLFR